MNREGALCVVRKFSHVGPRSRSIAEWPKHGAPLVHLCASIHLLHLPVAPAPVAWLLHKAGAVICTEPASQAPRTEPAKVATAAHGTSAHALSSTATLPLCQMLCDAFAGDPQPRCAPDWGLAWAGLWRSAGLLALLLGLGALAATSVAHVRFWIAEPAVPSGTRPLAGAPRARPITLARRAHPPPPASTLSQRRGPAKPHTPAQEPALRAYPDAVGLEHMALPAFCVASGVIALLVWRQRARLTVPAPPTPRDSDFAARSPVVPRAGVPGGPGPVVTGEPAEPRPKTHDVDLWPSAARRALLFGAAAAATPAPRADAEEAILLDDALRDVTRAQGLITSALADPAAGDVTARLRDAAQLMDRALPVVGADAAYTQKDWRLKFRSSSFDPFVNAFRFLDAGADGASLQGPNQNISIKDIERLEAIEDKTSAALMNLRAAAEAGAAAEGLGRGDLVRLHRVLADVQDILAERE